MPLYEVFPFAGTSSFIKHGVPVHINLGDERGKSIGTAYPDSGKKDALQYPCYAAFLDPANAILVRSTGRVSKVIAATSTPSEDTIRNHGGELLNSALLCETAKKEASLLKDRISKPLFNVERVGFAEFVRSSGVCDDDGFPFGDTHPRRLKPERVNNAEFVPSKVELRHGNESWGPVTKDDPRVWLTII